MDRSNIRYRKLALNDNEAYFEGGDSDQEDHFSIDHEGSEENHSDHGDDEQNNKNMQEMQEKMR